MHLDASEVQKRVSVFKDLELWVVENHLMWVLETGSGPLKEEQMLLNAEPSLQIHTAFCTQPLS